MRYTILVTTFALALSAFAQAQTAAHWGGFELAPGESHTVAWTPGDGPEGRVPVLTLQARLDNERVGGFTQALRATVNGTALGHPELRNKPLRVKSHGGAVYSMASGDRFSTYYAPSFEAPDEDDHYGLTGGIRACHFALDIGHLLKNGENTITFENAVKAGLEYTLVVGDIDITYDVPQSEMERGLAPTGPLEAYAPRAPRDTAFDVEQEDDGTLRISNENKSWVVTSTFSTPEPGWTFGDTEWFDHERRIEQTGEAVVVLDTFVNKTDAPLGIMQVHRADLAGNGAVYLGGLEQPDGTGHVTEPSNPTAFAGGGASLGLIALSDAMRIHVETVARGDGIELADRQLVIAPGAEHTARWAIVPTDDGSYWTFINAARRLVDANFTIDGAFAFLRGGPPVSEWSDETFANFIRYKDAKYTCMSIMYPRYNGHYTHGTAFQRVDLSPYIESLERRRRLVPGREHLVYFHCFLDVTEDGPERFPDARTLRPDGTQATYGEAHQRLYFPTETNAYGDAVRKNAELIFDEIGADGVYWDEHEYSRYLYHYGEPWDGVSGDIDGSTHEVTRLKSSVTLMTEEWRVGLAKDILTRGPLIGNSVPMTEQMAALQYPCFVETGSITHCTRAHLYSPIALGDHLTERSEVDAYKTMLAALDYGCVYHWYSDTHVVPTHHTLTQYMYPITPVELHEGFIIGEERIITKKSGLFGWGDASDHEVHVFDHEGREIADWDAPVVERDGAKYSAIRLPEDYAAVIIRR